MTSPYSGVTVVVLGGSGFIGSWVWRALRARGAVVYAVVRESSRARALAESADHVTVADLTEPGAATRAITRIRPSIVFNLAGYGVDHSERDPEIMEALNSRLVAEICEAMSSEAPGPWTGLRLVHVGSALEYGVVPGALIETMTPNPTTDYGRTKLAGTLCVMQAAAAGLPATVARPFTVYGPGEHSDRLLPSLLSAARTGARVRLSHGAQRRDFTYVEDVVEGLLRLGVNGMSKGLIVNLATGVLTPVRAFAESAASALQLDAAALDFGAVPVRSEEMFHGDVDVTRVKNLLNWWPQTSVADGIRRTWEIERER